MVTLNARAVIETLIEFAVLGFLGGLPCGYLLRGWLG